MAVGRARLTGGSILQAQRRDDIGVGRNKDLILSSPLDVIEVSHGDPADVFALPVELASLRGTYRG